MKLTSACGIASTLQFTPNGAPGIIVNSAGDDAVSFIVGDTANLSAQSPKI